jgi:uncharacterized protein YhaN
VARIAKLLGDISASASPDEIKSCIGEWEKRIAAAKATFEQLAERRTRLEQAQAAVTRWRRRFARKSAARRRLLRQAGARDGGHLAEILDKSRLVDQLREREFALSQEIRDVLGTATEESMAQALIGSDEATLNARRQELARSTNANLERLQAMNRERGRLEQEWDALRNSSDLELTRVRLDTVEAELTERVEKWQVQSLVLAAIKETQEWFEVHRQPKTLGDAGEYFRQLTQGRYERVFTRLGQRQLWVQTPQGDSLPVDALSSGAREQLFLSLRLALAGEFASRGACLPLVLDDVLVNFDRIRAGTALEVLQRFAQGGNQVLLFTCHEHILEQCRQLGIRSEVLPLPLDNNKLPRQERVERLVEVTPVQAGSGWEPAVNESVPDGFPANPKQEVGSSRIGGSDEVPDSPWETEEEQSARSAVR